MIDHILIDTDVLLDFFFDREPFAEFAAGILDCCEEKSIKGFTTPVIICNVYYLLRKAERNDIIIEKLKLLLTIIDIIDMNKEVVVNALNSDFKDFEDALQNFSAIQNEHISIILTRNIRDFKKSKLAVISPEIYLRGIS